MESNLESLDEQLKCFFKFSLDFIFILDLNEKILDLNLIALDNLGYAKEEILNNSFSEFLSNDYVNLFAEYMKKINRKKRPNEKIIIGLKKKNGSYLDIEFYGVPIQKKGDIYLILGIGHDFSEYEKIQEEVEKERITLDNIINLNPFAIALFDSEGHNIRRNQAFVDLFKSIPPNNYSIFNDPILKKHSTHNELLKAQNGETIKIPEIWYNPSMIYPDYSDVRICFQMVLFPIFNKYGEIENYVGMAEDITEKKIAEQKLIESEENFRELFNSSTEMIFLHNMENGAILNVNKKTCEMFGYTKEEFLTLNVGNISEGEPPYTQKEALELILRAVNRHPQLFEWKAKKKDGTIFWGEVNLKRVNLGGAGYILASCRDITERKQAEEALRLSQLNLQTLFNSIQDFIFVLSMDGHILEVNNRVIKDLGYSENEILNMGVLDLHPPDRRDEAAIIVKEILEDKTDLCSVPIMTKNSTVIPIETKATKGKWGNQEVIFGISRDITDRVVADQKLKESEEKYRYLFEQSPNAVVLMDLKGRFIEFNSMVEKIFGYSEKDLLGKNFVRDGVIHPEYLPKAIELYKDVTLGSGFATGEYLYYKKDRSLMWGLTQGSRIRIGDQMYVQTIIQDITEHKEADMRLKESEEKYRIAYNRENFYKDLFAHDMSNILQGMLSSLEFFELQAEFSEISSISKEMLKIYENQVKRAINLVKNVRKFSELDKTQISLKNIDYRNIINNAYKIVSKYISDRKINLQIDFTSVISSLKADEFLLDVFENLLYNSVKHNENEEVEILIKSSAIQKEGGRFLKLEFIDNGKGIPDSRKRSIFMRGINEDKSVSGIGLGLSLVKKILDNYNAKIYIENRICEDFTKGSNFILLFPEVS